MAIAAKSSHKRTGTQIRRPAYTQVTRDARHATRIRRRRSFWSFLDPGHCSVSCIIRTLPAHGRPRLVLFILEEARYVEPNGAWQGAKSNCEHLRAPGMGFWRFVTPRYVCGSHTCVQRWGGGAIAQINFTVLANKEKLEAAGLDGHLAAAAD